MYIVQDYSLADHILCRYDALLGIVGEYAEISLQDLEI